MPAYEDQERLPDGSWSLWKPALETSSSPQGDVKERRIQEDRTAPSPSPDEGEVEAVAIGLYFQEPAFNRGSAIPWKELTYHQRQHMREKARSVIAALDAHRKGDKG